MATVAGKEYRPVIASKGQTILISRYESNKEMTKKLHEENDLILKTLAQEIKDKLIVVESEEGMKSYMLGKPTGTFIYFNELDFVHKAKTTKKDMAIIEEIKDLVKVENIIEEEIGTDPSINTSEEIDDDSVRM